MKILILLLYYNRPNMVKNALYSINQIKHDNWELAFIDDGSENAGEPVARAILNDLDKVTFYQSGDLERTKIINGGSVVGRHMNAAIKNSDAEIAIMLCDDDAIYPGYLTNINKWFLDDRNRHRMYGHSSVVLFNPFNESPGKFKSDIAVRDEQNKHNRYVNYLNKDFVVKPSSALDASQVAWKTTCNNIDNIWFPYPMTSNLDAVFYENLYKAYGRSHHMKCFGQYKAIYPNCLSERASMYYVIDLPDQIHPKTEGE